MSLINKLFQRAGKKNKTFLLFSFYILDVAILNNCGFYVSTCFIQYIKVLSEKLFLFDGIPIKSFDNVNKYVG